MFDILALSRCAVSHQKFDKVSSLYYYATDQTASEVLTTGFFNEARDQLGVNDTIICAVDSASTAPDTLMVRIVEIDAAGVVTVAANTGAAGA